MFSLNYNGFTSNNSSNVPILFPDKVDKRVVDVCSARLEETGAWRQLVEEEQLLFLGNKDHNLKKSTVLLWLNTNG